MPNIGLNTSIFNTTQICPRHFRNFMCGNVRGASTKYWSENHHIQQYKNTPTVLQKLHTCLLGICVVLVQNIGISTRVSNTTQIRPQHFRNLMCVHWECAWCQCQLLVLEPSYLTLHRYARDTSETSCVGMCVVLVPNIGLRTTISNNTKICPQYFKNFMRVHCEYAWCQCQILVLAPACPTLHRYAHSTSETSCVSTGNVLGASAKYWSQNHHIQHYTNMPTAFQKLHVLPLGMCVVLMPNIGLYTSIFNTTQICPRHFRNFMCGNVRGASTKYWSENHHIQQYKNTPTVLQKLHECPLGMCVVLVSNIGISTSISNTTHICPQYFRNFMCVHWECAWCQFQILVLAPTYPTVHKYAHSTSETSCVSTGNVRCASSKYWYQHQHIQHYTNTPTADHNLHVCPLRMCVVLVPNIGLRTTIYPTLHKYAHSTTEA